MSNFIIGNKPITSISGPMSVTVLKPDKYLKERFEKEGGRLPYIMLFGDYHFERSESCEDCKCDIPWLTGKGWDKKKCCYGIDDPEFLKLFDGVATKNYPIDLYTEQIYEPRLGDPDIYKINEIITRQDKVGYMASFIHKYRVCYSKQDRRTKKYREECPTRDIRWHFIDTRKVEFGKSDDALLYKGIFMFYKVLYLYFNKDKPEDDSFKQSMLAFEKYNKEMTMVFDIITNGPEFLNKYLTQNSNFLINKQVNKQTIPELRDINLWKTIMFDRINQTFHNYIDKYEFTLNDYIVGMEFYKAVLVLLSDSDSISETEFLERRKTLMDSVSKYNLFEENLINLTYMFSLTTAASMMDIYTLTRMLKKPKDGIPGFLSMVYLGEAHIENIKDILMKYFGYTVVGESSETKLRCQDVTNIDFDLVKVKKEFT